MSPDQPDLFSRPVVPPPPDPRWREDARPSRLYSLFSERFPLYVALPELWPVVKTKHTQNISIIRKYLESEWGWTVHCREFHRDGEECSEYRIQPKEWTDGERAHD